MGPLGYEPNALNLCANSLLEKKSGGAGFRSLCLPIANRPLYRVSYTPLCQFRGSIVVSIPACHAGNPGSIPGLGAFLASSGQKEKAQKSDTFSICACHPCAGAMLIFSVSFQFYRMRRLLHRSGQEKRLQAEMGIASWNSRVV